MKPVKIDVQSDQGMLSRARLVRDLLVGFGDRLRVARLDHAAREGTSVSGETITLRADDERP